MAQTVSIIPDTDPPEKRGSRVLAVIPARLASTRLPRKVLREIAGQPMLAWVYNAALACPGLDGIVIATDSEEVAALCRHRGWPHHMSSPDLNSGSDRVEAVAREVPADIYVNIQGDEPLLRPEHISALLLPFRRPHVEVSTLRVACTAENIDNPNAVKVVTAPDGRALYFSRAAIPFHRDASSGQAADCALSRPPMSLVISADTAPPEYWKHIGLYAYTADALHRFTALPPSPLEKTERLEQLRFLENGIPIYVETTRHDTVGVDTEADLEAVARILERNHAVGGSEV